MPQLGESMAEATIVSIKVKPGDKVAADQSGIDGSRLITRDRLMRRGRVL